MCTLTSRVHPKQCNDCNFICVTIEKSTISFNDDAKKIVKFETIVYHQEA